MALDELYDVLGRLHKGRSCVVYRARDRKLGAPVILKVTKPGAAAAKLRHEYSIVSRLDVSGIVRVRKLEEEQDGIALVSDDVGGETLAMHLARGLLSLPEVLRAAIEIAGTLDELHKHRVIHKDINPSNILIDAGGRASCLTSTSRRACRGRSRAFRSRTSSPARCPTSLPSRPGG